MWWHRHNRKTKHQIKRRPKIDLLDFCEQKEAMIEYKLSDDNESTKEAVEKAANDLKAVPQESKVEEAEEAQFYHYDSDPDLTNDFAEFEIPNSEPTADDEEEEDLAAQYICGEFVLLFDRLGLKRDDKVDNNLIYRAICGRSPCDLKLAYFCDKFETYYFSDNPQKRLLTNLDYFDKISEMAIVDGWDCMWIYDIAHEFNLDLSPTNSKDPVNVVVLSTLIALELFYRFPKTVAMKGRFLYFTGDSLKFFRDLLDDPTGRSTLLKEINISYGKIEIKDVSALLRHCMSLGLGWLSAEKHGKMLHNHIIKSIVLEEIPEYMSNFENYQVCQFVMNTICGDNNGYAVTEHFTLCSEENWKTLHRFLSVDIPVRIRVFDEYIDDKIVMLANEIVSDKVLEEFEVINEKRANVRENIGDCIGWLNDFSRLVQLD